MEPAPPIPIETEHTDYIVLLLKHFRGQQKIQVKGAD
jgi:hypothetical protein